MRVLGVDPGTRRIGLALSDEEGRMALPHRTIERTRQQEDGAPAVADVAREAEVGRIVIGLPIKLDGTEGSSARRARQFGARVKRRVDVPVVFWDERLTSQAAEQGLAELGVRGSKRRRAVDQAAAAILLQSYLDAKSERRWSEQDIERQAAAEPRPGRKGRGRSRGR